MTTPQPRLTVDASLLERIEATLGAAAKAAAAQTLPRFRADIAVTNKLETGFDPVTEADREAERAIRQVIASQFTDHAIVGEEWDNVTSESPFSWIIDPIDGTRAYISGVPVWGTLIGVTFHGRAIAGIMDQPFTGETFMTSQGRTRYRRDGREKTLATSKIATLASARLFTTSPGLFSRDKRAAYDTVEAAALQYRYGCDCYGYALLAAGHADLVIETDLQTYDIAALVPIIEQAGGVITNWNGGRPEAGGDIIAAATPELHAVTRAILHRP